MPSPREMEAISKALMAIPVPNTRIRMSSSDRAELVHNIGSSAPSVTHWILRTPLRPDEVRAFYLDSAHRAGWNVVSRAKSTSA